MDTADQFRTSIDICMLHPSLAFFARVCGNKGVDPIVFHLCPSVLSHDCFGGAVILIMFQDTFSISSTNKNFILIHDYNLFHKCCIIASLWFAITYDYL